MKTKITLWQWLYMCMGLLFYAGPIVAQPAEPAPRGEQVIEPEVARRDIVVPQIDTENFEVGVGVGVLSIEDFGANTAANLRMTYHITEDFFFDGIYTLSTISDASFRHVGLAIFPQENETLTHYNLAVGFNALPGEFFLRKNRAINTDLYVSLGLGNISFIGEDQLTTTMALGWRLLPADWWSIHIMARHVRFESELLGQNKMTHNVEITGGFSIFF